MRNAVNNFQKQLFILLLFASTFSGFLADIALEGGRTMLYVAFDGLIIFLSMLSLGYLRGRFTWVVLFIIACIGINLSYSTADFVSSLNGIREILMVVSMAIFYNKVFAEDNEHLAEEYIEIMKKF